MIYMPIFHGDNSPDYYTVSLEAKEKFCTMWGGDITLLAEELGHNLYQTEIGKGLEIYFETDEKIVIKGNREGSGVKYNLRNAFRRIKDLGKSEIKRSSDFCTTLIFDEGGVNSTLHNPEEWKKLIYEIIQETTTIS